MTTTWRKLITEAMRVNKDETPLEFATLAIAPGELDREFYEGYGGTNGEPFLMHTEHWVYFPCCYDGAEWCDSVPRHPTGKPVGHIGGG